MSPNPNGLPHQGPVDPKLVDLCNRLVDLANECGSTNIMLGAMANVAGALIVNASDSIVELNDIAGRFVDMVHDTCGANWDVAKAAPGGASSAVAIERSLNPTHPMLQHLKRRP